MIHSTRGKNVILYLMCLCAAFVFWVLLSLDTEVQRDFDVPVELTGVPDSVILIGHMPRTISTTVQGKGSQLLQFRWGKMSPVKFRFTPGGSGDKMFVLAKTQIDSRIRDYFGAGVLVHSMRPDSIQLAYTTDPGKRVALRIAADIRPNLQCILSGPIKANVDSVMVYSTSDIPRELTYVETDPIVKTDLKDTMRYEVRIRPIDGMRIIPDRVIVTVPVEPLIAKKRTVRIDVINMPAGKAMFTFPGQVEVTYLVPMSAYSDEYPLKVYANYNDLHENSGSKIAVLPGATPEYVHNISLVPDSVEYVIEQID